MGKRRNADENNHPLLPGRERQHSRFEYQGSVIEHEGTCWQTVEPIRNPPATAKRTGESVALVPIGMISSNNHLHRPRVFRSARAQRGLHCQRKRTISSCLLVLIGRVEKPLPTAWCIIADKSHGNRNSRTLAVSSPPREEQCARRTRGVQRSVVGLFGAVLKGRFCSYPVSISQECTSRLKLGQLRVEAINSRRSWRSRSCRQQPC
jgi:hypothetical protein